MAAPWSAPKAEKEGIVIFSSQIQARKEFKLGNFFPVWILSRSEFDYWQQLFDAQGFHQPTEYTFHPILSSLVSKALKKWLEGRWFKPTLFQNFYQKLVKFLMVCLHGRWGKAWALKNHIHNTHVEYTELLSSLTAVSYTHLTLPTIA